MGHGDESNMQDTSGPEKSGVQLASLGIEDRVLVVLAAGLEQVPAASGMVN